MRRDWLVGIRNQLGYTQEKVSELTGIKRSTYNQYEIGRRNPTVKNAKKIASALGFEWTIFFADERRTKTQKETA